MELRTRGRQLDDASRRGYASGGAPARPSWTNTYLSFGPEPDLGADQRPPAPDVADAVQSCSRPDRTWIGRGRLGAQSPALRSQALFSQVQLSVGELGHCANNRTGVRPLLNSPLGDGAVAIHSVSSRGVLAIAGGGGRIDRSVTLPLVLAAKPHSGRFVRMGAPFGRPPSHSVDVADKAPRRDSQFGLSGLDRVRHSRFSHLMPCTIGRTEEAKRAWSLGNSYDGLTDLGRRLIGSELCRSLSRCCSSWSQSD